MEKGPVLKTQLCGLPGCVVGGRSGQIGGGFQEGPAAGLGNHRETAPWGKTAAWTHQHPPVRSFIIAPVPEDGEQPGMVEREGRGGGCQEQSGTLPVSVSRWDVPQPCFPMAQGLLGFFKHLRTSITRPQWWLQWWGRAAQDICEVSPQSRAQIPMDLSGAAGDVPGLTEKDTGFPPVPQPWHLPDPHRCPRPPNSRVGDWIAPKPTTAGSQARLRPKGSPGEDRLGKTRPRWRCLVWPWSQP